jgi:hypothetical protein
MAAPTAGPRRFKRNRLSAELRKAVLERSFVALDFPEDGSDEVGRNRAKRGVVDALGGPSSSGSKREGRKKQRKKTHRDDEDVTASRYRTLFRVDDLSFRMGEVDLFGDGGDEVFLDGDVGKAEPAFLGCECI